MIGYGFHCFIVAPKPARALPIFLHDAQTNAQWAAEELGSIQLGDRRSSRCMVKVFSQMLNSPGKLWAF